MQIRHPQPHVAQIANRIAGLENAWAVAIEHDLPRGDGLAQVFGGRRAIVVPRPARVGVGHIQDALRAHLLDDRFEPFLLLLRRELRIGVTGHQGVVFTGGAVEHFAEIELAANDLHARGGILHHRGAVVEARREVVAEAERVAELVGREQPLPQQHHVALRRRHRSRLRRQAEEVVRRRQEHRAIVAGGGGRIAFPVIADGADAMRVHARLRAENLAGARIAIRAAAREAALVAIDPENPRVADVHRIHVGRRILHLHGVAIAGGFERLVPQQRALAHRGANRLGDAGVEIEDDRRLRFAHRRRPASLSPGASG